MRNRFISLLVAATLTAAACGDGGAAAAGDLAVSDVPRMESDASAQDIATAAEGNREFAVEAYAGLLETNDGNLVFSPASIRLALAMAWAGAAGETAEEMAATLHFDLPDDRMHAALNGIDALLASRNHEEEPGPDGEEREVVLTIGNALWGQQDVVFLDDFLDTLAVNYGAGMHLVDFAGDAEAARAAINDWVADQTDDRITDLIPSGALNALTRLVLTNAVYLDATWERTFDADATDDEPFTTLDGTEVTVDMMHQLSSFPYASGDGWQAVELPYVGGELAMLIVVPDRGRFEEVEGGLATGLLDEAIAGLESADVGLGLPKWEFRTKAGLSDLLRSLGMVDAFDELEADFSGMTTEEPLFISDVIHEAFIEVDEQGTEAAAATAVVMETRAIAQLPEVELTVDRPFVFSLYDRETGEILFMGRVVNPAA